MLSVRVCADAPVGSAAKNATATAAHSVVPRTFLMRILPSDGDGSEKVRKRSRASTLSRGELRRRTARNWTRSRRSPPTGWKLVRAPREWSRARPQLDHLKDRLYRSLGVEVRPDLQVRAEIIIQPEEGRLVFTPDELRHLVHDLESILLNSSPGAGWPFRLTLKQYIGLFSPLFTHMGDEKRNASAS